MIINDTVAKARAWSIPAISALMILHHDFQLPRLSQIRQLAWSENAVNVLLEYGTCNVSGDIVDSSEFFITLHQSGAIGVQLNDISSSKKKQKKTLITFLAGEILRETKRWNEDMVAWNHNRSALTPERGSILNIVGALIAYPAPEIELVVEKRLNKRTSLIKARIIDQATVIDIRSRGIQSANLYIRSNGKTASAGAIRHAYKKYDVPNTIYPLQSRHRRILTEISFNAVQLVRLPIDFIMCLCEEIWAPKSGSTPYVMEAPAQHLEHL
jgi:hypothetical protein